ncbi:MAG: hypothetical protein CMJ19_14265 [Phycisphaeraceae bacterium]|nr:hypothetical protein [Phycisphaeraceae bacterium]
MKINILMQIIFPAPNVTQTTLHFAPMSWRLFLLDQRLKWLTAMTISLTMSLPTLGQVNMIGRQSQNEGIMVLPASKPVQIDGDLSDWNQTGRIRCFADQLLSDRYSATVTAMWDQTYLYLAIDWNDPTPMGSFIDPRFNPDTGWKSDCVQLRFKTADQVTWIDGWFHKPSKSSVIRITVWDDMNNWRENQARSLVAKPGSNELGEDAQQAFAKTDTGYIQELRIPWKMITRNKPDLQSGMHFQIGMEFLWGDPAGSDKLIHRYADNIQAGITSREFYWNNHRVWGNATLTDQPQVVLRQYQPKTDRLTGPVPIKLTLPNDAKIVSLAIDDAHGNRVRNIGGLKVADYVTHHDDNAVQVTIPWDTMADAVWKGNHNVGYDPQYAPVATGQYTVKALCHPGIDATYEMSFYNPGTPTWDVADGSGAWGADHTPPHIVAASGSNIIIAWEFAEGGWGMIGLDRNGKKIWSEKRGARALAADEQFVYAIPEHFNAFSPPPAIIRLDAATGDYKPFFRDGKERPFVLHLSDIFNSKQLGKPNAIAVGKNYLAIAYAEHDRIALIDKHDASFVRQLSVDMPSAMTYNAQDQLVVISNNKLCTVDQNTAKTTVIPTPGLQQAVGLTCDHNGNYLTFDAGSDSQIKAYTPQGKLAYTCGQTGGRAIRGPYDPKGIMHGSSVTVDSNNNVWVTESWDYPRRVSVWDKSGKRIREYLGNTGYAGNATTLHDSDPTLAYLGPLEFKIDHAKRTWKLQSILWHPDPTKGESFEIPTDRFAKPQRFASDASGSKREYFLSLPYYNQHGYILLMQLDNGNWQPVTAITTVSQIAGKLGKGNTVLEQPSGQWADCDLLDGVFWNDTNHDGRVQRDECEIIKTEYPAAGKQRRKSSAFSFNSGWGGRMDSKLRIYASGMTRIQPVGFDDRGAPIYTSESIKPMNLNEQGTMVPDEHHNQVLISSKLAYPAPSRICAVDAKTGQLNWTYPNPFPGVHGSHRATMPKPGLIIGPLMITGQAHVNDTVGNVFHLRGNLGQDYFMTNDGIFVDTLFADGRLPALPLPDSEAKLIGKSVNAFTQSGEAFNGFFGKQADGKIRLTCALARQACMILDVHGLENITRLPTQTVTITNTHIAKALHLQSQMQGDANKDKTYTMHRLTSPFKADGKANEWSNTPAMEIARQGGQQSGIAKLAYDAKNLYAYFNVTDSSPWLNQGKDFTRLFKTGDAVDIQFSPTGNTQKEPIMGDLRILIANFNGKPTAVLMMPKAKHVSESEKQIYISPVMTHPMDKVVILKDATLQVRTTGNGYVVEAQLPLNSLGMTLKPNMQLTADVGFISSDATGSINTARTYWSNKQTNLISDLPAESWLYPSQWGNISIK